MSCLNDFLWVRGKVLVPFYGNRSQQISSKHSNEHYLANLKCFISLSFPCHPTVLPMEHYFVSSVSSEKFHLPPEKQLESCKMGPYYKIPHSPSHFKHTFLPRRDQFHALSAGLDRCTRQCTDVQIATCTPRILLILKLIECDMWFYHRVLFGVMTIWFAESWREGGWLVGSLAGNIWNCPECQ